MKSTKTTSAFLVVLLFLCLLDIFSIACANAKIKKATKTKTSTTAQTNLKTNTQTKAENKISLEDPEDQKVRDILKDDYPTFVKNLGENIKDPKFRSAIRSLSSVNKVNSKYLNATVLNLIPTQNEIDVDKSLKFPLTNVNSTRNYLFCKEPIRIMGNTIVTSADGKYVIDGHHRWSQVYSLNPKCQMASVDLTDIKDPINALKSTQLGIAAGQDKNGNDITSIPVAIVEGKNLLKISEADLKAYVVNTVTNDVLAVFKEFDATLDTKEKIAEYIWKNVQSMLKNNQSVPGAPARGVMPQTDMAPNWIANTLNTDKLLNTDEKSFRTNSTGFVFSSLFAVLALLFITLL